VNQQIDLELEKEDIRRRTIVLDYNEIKDDQSSLAILELYEKEMKELFSCFLMALT